MTDEIAAEAGHQNIDVREDEDWKGPLKVGFDRMASLKIARYVLAIFSGVYLLCFVMLFSMFRLEDANYEKAAELVKFMLQSILPLVTLAVGYYLGDKSRQESASE